jgi:hypothetical protein
LTAVEFQDFFVGQTQRTSSEMSAAHNSYNNMFALHILATDLQSIMFDGYVQIVNCFFSLSFYTTQNSLAPLQGSIIVNAHRSSCEVPVKSCLILIKPEFA